MFAKNQLFFEVGGYEFESGVVDIVSDFAKSEWGNKAIKFSTVQQDRYEGTDVFVLGVPIDVTLAFEKKNKTRKLGALSLNGVTIDFRLRFGNGKAKVQTPVPVIGAETAVGISKSNMWVALDTIKCHIREILNKGMDKYFVALES
jgi:hypothetical protein